MPGLLVNHICLVQPSCILSYSSSKTVWPPLGLLSLAASLRGEGFTVSVIDGILEGFEGEIPLSDDTFLMGLPPRELAAKILARRADVVGLSVLFPNQVDCAIETARLLREADRSIFLLWGGPVVTLNSDQYTRLTEVDGIVLGEAEVSLPAYLRILSEAGPDGQFPPGTGVRRGESLELNTEYSPVEDLDALPAPARDLVDLPRYMAKVRQFKVLPRQQPTTTIVSSRGCPHRCNFCSSPVLYRRSYRSRSPQNVIAEIDQLVGSYGVRELMFVDENFSANPTRTQQLLDLLIDRARDLTWFPMAGLNVMSVTEALLEKMARSGLYKVKFSFESGCERILREVIHKPMDIRHAERMVRAAKALGLPVGGNFILGFPQETRSDIMQSLEFAEKLDLDFTLWSIATPYRHTELADYAIEQGLLPEDFAFTALDPSRAYWDLADVTRAELEQWRYDFWRKLNFSSAEKSSRYYTYALQNSDYRPPDKVKAAAPSGEVASQL